MRDSGSALVEFVAVLGLLLLLLVVTAQVAAFVFTSSSVAAAAEAAAGIAAVEGVDSPRAVRAAVGILGAETGQPDVVLVDAGDDVRATVSLDRSFPLLGGVAISSTAVRTDEAGLAP